MSAPTRARDLLDPSGRPAVARAGWLVSLCALLLPALAHATEWRIADLFPNPMASAAGALRQATVRGPEGVKVERVRYYLYAWDAQTGLFYQSVDEPQEGPICLLGVPAGAHPGYGRAGAGYDWYAVTPAGHFYLGWQFFQANCTFEVGAVPDPFGPNRLAFPAIVDDGEGATFALQVPSATSVFNAAGELLAHYPPLDGAVSQVTMWLDGAYLAWQLDDPNGWRYTVWFDRLTAGILRSRLEREGILVEERDSGEWVLP